MLHIGPFTLAKPKIQKTWLFVPFTLPENPYHSGVLARKAHARKNPNIILVFLVSGAHARLLSTFDRTKCSAHYVAGRGRVIPPKVTYYVTKNPNNTGEIGAGVYIGKNPLKNPRSFKIFLTPEVGFSIRVFLQCLGVVA